MDKASLLQSLNCPMTKGIATLLFTLYKEGVKYKPMYISDNGRRIIFELEDISLTVCVNLQQDGSYVAKMTFLTDVEVFTFEKPIDLKTYIIKYLCYVANAVAKSEIHDNSLTMLNLMIEAKDSESADSSEENAEVS